MDVTVVALKYCAAKLVGWEIEGRLVHHKEVCAVKPGEPAVA